MFSRSNDFRHTASTELYIAAFNGLQPGAAIRASDRVCPSILPYIGETDNISSPRRAGWRIDAVTERPPKPSYRANQPDPIRTNPNLSCGVAMSDYLSAAKAAEAIGVSETTIRKRILSGALPAEKEGGRWVISQDDLDRQKIRASHADPIGSDPNQSNPTRISPTQPNPIQLEPRQSNPIQSEPVHAEWREDLLAQVTRLEADKAESTVRLDEAARRETEAGLREERSKARVIDLERELTVRDSRMADMHTEHGSRVADMQAERDTDVAGLRGQVAILEAKLREILEDGKNEALQLANRNADLADRIAGLVASHEDMHARVVELQPVAEQVPMLQAAVEEKDASLSERERELGDMRQDIESIASRPVTGPVFRLLTKGRLRR
ncbi:MAG: helix-turn-helix domain-containing protein [Candidatus Poribacteria bacterium]